MHAGGQLQLSELLDLATARERRRAVALAAVIRVVGAALFLTLALVMSRGSHAREFAPYVPLLTAYSVVALGFLYLHERAGVVRFAWAPTLLDLGALYGIQ